MPQKRKREIYLDYSVLDEKYRVQKCINTTKYDIGKWLTKNEVKKMLVEAFIEIIITEYK